MSDNYALIRKAILQRSPLAASYNGYRRLMCPHVLGLKNGREQALLYQYGGEHERPLAPIGSSDNWRCFIVGKMSDVELIEGPWHTAAKETGNQVCIDQIDVAVEPFLGQSAQNPAAPR